MGLADFGKPTGEFGTIEKTNEDDALVKWDDHDRTRQHQSLLRFSNSADHESSKGMMIWII
jgi:hypothetical protein